MINYEFSEHASDMLNERNIQKTWVESTMSAPDTTEIKDDGTTHYIKAIKENGGRHLRVIVNPNAKPQKIVTLYFDRKLGRRP
ncbi:MAG: DUF4258 domain-containing protein [Nitrospirota bacterium]